MKTKLRFTLITLFFTLSLHSQHTDLFIQDPQSPWSRWPATVEKATFVCQPKGFYTLVDLYITFSARDAFLSAQDQVEVVFDFSLPEKAMVIDSWLWVEDVIIRAKILDRWTASGIYEDIVGRRQDPSILFKMSARQYQLRIFPMAGNGSRRVKISYMLPAEWTPDAVLSYIPTGFLQLSSRPVETVAFRNFPEAGWEELSIPELPDRSFEVQTDPELGNYQEVVLPSTGLPSQITLAAPSPLKDGVYLSKLDNVGDNYYQMALLPTKVFDLPSAQSRKVMLLFDYKSNGSTISQQELLSQARDRLKSNLLPTDSFNIMLSSLTITPVSDHWLPARPEVIDSVFNSMGDNPIANYSSIPSLLGTGIEYFSSRNEKGAIILFADSDNEGDVDIANPLIRDLMDLMTTGIIPIHIYDYQNVGLNSYWINNQRFIGNEYFYHNLTRLTSGILVRQFNNPRPFSENMSAIMESVSAFTGNIDVYTTLDEGFCYNRFNLSKEGELVNLNRPILQIGKYQGDFPFVIEAAGEFDGLLFGESMQIEEPSILQADSLLEESWVGNYIQGLERSEQSNATITDRWRRSSWWWRESGPGRGARRGPWSRRPAWEASLVWNAWMKAGMMCLRT